MSICSMTACRRGSLALGDGLGEGIEIHDDEVDGLEAEELGLAGLLGVLAAQKDGAPWTWDGGF